MLFRSAYLEFLEKIDGKRRIMNRNRRDNIYNINVLRESAVLLAERLYYKECLCLLRKYSIAQKVAMWTRPDNVPRRDWSVKRWSPSEDEFIETHSIQESCDKLDRTKSSVKLRLYALKKKA